MPYILSPLQRIMSHDRDMLMLYLVNSFMNAMRSVVIENRTKPMRELLLCWLFWLGSILVLGLLLLPV